MPTQVQDHGPSGYWKCDRIWYPQATLRVQLCLADLFAFLLLPLLLWLCKAWGIFSPFSNLACWGGLLDTWKAGKPSHPSPTVMSQRSSSAIGAVKKVKGVGGRLTVSGRAAGLQFSLTWIKIQTKEEFSRSKCLHHIATSPMNMLWFVVQAVFW